MSTTVSWTLELGLGGSYRDTVEAEGDCISYWPLDEYRGTVADDRKNVLNGTYSGTMFLGVVGPCPEGGTSMFTVAGAAGMDVADNAAHKTTRLSIEAWIYPIDIGTDRALIQKSNNALTNGYGFWYAGTSGSGSTGVVGFWTGNLATMFTAGFVNVSQWNHIVGTFDGTNNRLYINGVLAGTTLAAVLTHDASQLRCARHTPFSDFNGAMSHVAYYDEALSLAQVQAHYAAGSWTDVTADFVREFSVDRGIQGMTPNDRMASTGTFEFALKNGTQNSARLLGYYSPSHDNVRSGFTFGIPVRLLGLRPAGAEYQLFRGKLHVIAPETGTPRSRLTHCIAHDCIKDLSDNLVREIAIAAAVAEDELMYRVIESLPFDARPPGVSMDSGLDTYPYAFDLNGGGTSAQTLLSDFVLSSQGLMTVNGDGTLRYLNRHTIALFESEFTLDDTFLADLEVPSDLTNVYNRVRITIHPRTVDVAATTVLFSHEGVPSVAAGADLELWGEYRNPNNDDIMVGGTAMVAPVATTDYTAFQNPDGTGTNLTASVSVTATYYASTVKYLLHNSHATLTAYFNHLQARGKGIYDLAPITVESFSAQPYGDRLLELDLLYQDDTNVAVDLAGALESQLNQLGKQVHSFTIKPLRHEGLVDAALFLTNTLCFPGTISETVSGVEADVFVRSAHLLVADGTFEATFGTAARISGSVFVLDESELDDPEDGLGYA